MFLCCFVFVFCFVVVVWLCLCVCVVFSLFFFLFLLFFFSFFFFWGGGGVSLLLGFLCLFGLFGVVFCCCCFWGVWGILEVVGFVVFGGFLVVGFLLLLLLGFFGGCSNMLAISLSLCLSCYWLSVLTLFYVLRLGGNASSRGAAGRRIDRTGTQTPTNAATASTLCLDIAQIVFGIILNSVKWRSLLVI